MSTSGSGEEALEPNKEDWVVPEYGKVRMETGATGAADEEPMPTYKPKMVHRGHYGGQEEEPEPKAVKPKMVGSGQLEAERRAELQREQAKVRAKEEEERAKEEAKLQEEQEFVCRSVETARQLASSLQSKEDLEDSTSKKLVMNLVKGVCPALKAHAKRALHGFDCAELKERLASYFDDRYEGKVPQTKQAKCNGKEVEIRNYALAQALHSANQFFNIGFCPEEKAFDDCAAAATGATGAAEPEPTKEEGPEATEELIRDADKAEAATKAVLADTAA